MNRIYLRKSTILQENERQEYILEQKGYNLDECEVYEETYSGKVRQRPMLNKMLEDLVKGDNVVVTDLTRLARSVKDLWEIGDLITNVGANLISIKENVDLETSTGRLLFTVIGAIGQFERETLSDRTKEALQAKKKNGIILGRPITLDKTLLDDCVNEYMNSNKSMLVVSKEYDISNATLCGELKKRNLKREKK
jgi:DNA invertase Pin-like site-specific DNA recombinase